MSRITLAEAVREIEEWRGRCDRYHGSEAPISIPMRAAVETYDKVLALLARVSGEAAPPGAREAPSLEFALTQGRVLREMLNKLAVALPWATGGERVDIDEGIAALTAARAALEDRARLREHAKEIRHPLTESEHAAYRATFEELRRVSDPYALARTIEAALRDRSAAVLALLSRVGEAAPPEPGPYMGGTVVLPCGNELRHEIAERHPTDCPCWEDYRQEVEALSRVRLSRSLG